MAKQIKAIKCPQCGSTDKTELRPEQFRCNNCNTEYFLDDDDININHNFRYDPPPVSTTPPPAKNLKRVLPIAFVLLLLLWGIPALIVKMRGRESSTSYQPPATEDFHWYSSDKGAFISAAGKPIGVIVGQRSYNNQSDEDSRINVYLAFYDLESGKELKAEKMSHVSIELFGTDFKICTFKNGDLYFIIAKTKIFKVNKSSLSATDVTQSLFARHPELTSGIANAEAIYESDGDGFNLIANDGMNYYYYPMQDRLYTKEQKQAAEDALEVEQPGEKQMVKFGFSSKSSDYPEEKRQLIRYTQRDPQGGPDDEPYFEWRESTQFQGPAIKTIFRWGTKLVRSWKDLTPGRQYFEPKVLYGDAEVVLILFANTPAEKSARSLQCLDANNGTIRFTLPLSSNYYLDEALRYKDGFVIDNNISMLLVSNAGKLLTEFKHN